MSSTDKPVSQPTLEQIIGISVGNRVVHKREPNWIGTVRHVDLDSYPTYAYGVTTCRVQWDGYEDGDTDIQWTNKLEVLS